MAITLPPVPIGEPAGGFAWQQWYLALQSLYAGSGTIAWALVDKTGSNITDIVLRDHANLQSMQGGQSGERYHLTLTEYNAAHNLLNRTTKSVAGAADVTLTSSEAQCRILEFTGVLTGNINVIVPTSVWEWIIFNNTTGAFTLTVKTLAGTGIVVATAKRAILYCDATNVVRATADV